MRAGGLWIGLWTGLGLGQTCSFENDAVRVPAASFWAIILRMRVGLFIVSAFVASTGAALAQSDWVVDPWSLPTPTPESSIATAVEGPDHASGLEPRPAHNQHREWLYEWSAELSDPWAGDAATEPGLAAAPTHPVPERAKRESGEWAKPLSLVVDPWASEPKRFSAPVVELIVDPWAHE